ncbi:hypothetical protein ACWC98_33215 [Streptomyces goshikiensis]
MPENAGELVAPSVRADLAAIGTLRLDLASDDAACRQQLRAREGRRPRRPGRGVQVPSASQQTSPPLS